MRRILSLLLLLLPLISGASGGNELLEEANKLYSAQEFSRAAEMYNQILASGKESAEVYFNLGNACFKTGDFVQAILNYERAKLLAPQNEDISFNLKIANQYVVDNLDQLPKPFFTRWWSTLANKASAGGWAKISTISFILFLLLLGSFFFSRSMRLRKLAFYTAMIAAITLVLSFSLAFHQHALIKNRTAAIVKCPRVTVKSAPAATGTDLFLIHEGLKVRITDSLDKWKEVELSDGNKGWMMDSCLVRI